MFSERTGMLNDKQLNASFQGKLFHDYLHTNIIVVKQVKFLF